MFRRSASCTPRIYVSKQWNIQWSSTLFLRSYALRRWYIIDIAKKIRIQCNYHIFKKIIIISHEYEISIRNASFILPLKIIHFISILKTTLSFVNLQGAHVLKKTPRHKNEVYRVFSLVFVLKAPIYVSYKCCTVSTMSLYRLSVFFIFLSLTVCNKMVGI